jgi:Tol biopolymer transport system component
MQLAPGTRLGAYEIVGLLGAGGMGEVFRAVDARLDRHVALKVLPEAVASDPERTARFQREAKVLASLNHPNIATIHGLEHANGEHFIVMELVEGETLADRIGRGPIPIDDALAIARQLAEGLEAAHEQGVIHRDLKPANIKLRPDGAVKVLDFGLAKALAGDGSHARVQLTNSPTITSPVAATGIGILLGTAPYMSPEQARGRPVDRRTDIWAFGCVFYEMLCGKRAFEGEDVTDALAAVVRSEPDWTALPPGLPAPVLRVLRACLQKDSHLRRQHIGDVRLDLTAINEPSPPVSVPQPETAALSRRRWAVVAVAAIASAALGVAVDRVRRAPVATEPIEFTIPAPAGATFATPPSAGSGVASQAAISPDGRQIVFVANDQNGYRLWLRSLATSESRPLNGTENGAFPFWSPDNRFIGFFAEGKLKTLSLSGGPAFVVCAAADGRGGTWSRDNVIVFAPSPRGVLQRVSAGGSPPVDVSRIDEEYGETNHRFPFFLPDGRHFLFTAAVGTCCPAAKPGQIRIGRVDTLDSTVLLQAESAAIYRSGYVLFNREGTLMAQSFDASSRTLAGDPVRVADGMDAEGSRYTSVSASTNGVLVYGKGQAMPTSRLTWLDRTGRELATVGDAGTSPNLALSPDERAVVAAIGRGANIDIQSIDLQTGTQVRLTFDPGNDTVPIWSPDGQRIVFQGQRSGRSSLFQKTIAGTTTEEVLLDGGGGNIVPTDWSSDGRYLLYTLVPFGGNNDIWVLPFTADRKPIPFLQTAAVESDAVFAPNGKWVAYSSRENAQSEVYVEPFPRTGGKIQISRSGGTKPIWRRDGAEIYYLSSDLHLMAAAFNITNGRAETPQALFSIPNVGVFAVGRQYAVSRDGQRFLFNMRQPQAEVPLTVIVNWPATLQK